jgi:hypothetical protein
MSSSTFHGVKLIKTKDLIEQVEFTPPYIEIKKEFAKPDFNFSWGIDIQLKRAQQLGGIMREVIGIAKELGFFHFLITKYNADEQDFNLDVVLQLYVLEAMQIAFVNLQTDVTITIGCIYTYYVMLQLHEEVSERGIEILFEHLCKDLGGLRFKNKYLNYIENDMINLDPLLRDNCAILYDKVLIEFNDILDLEIKEFKIKKFIKIIIQNPECFLTGSFCKENKDSYFNEIITKVREGIDGDYENQDYVTILSKEDVKFLLSLKDRSRVFGTFYQLIIIVFMHYPILNFIRLSYEGKIDSSYHREFELLVQEFRSREEDYVQENKICNNKKQIMEYSVILNNVTKVDEYNRLMHKNEILLSVCKRTRHLKLNICGFKQTQFNKAISIIIFMSIQDKFEKSIELFDYFYNY